VRGACRKEDAHEFEALHQQFRDDLEPVGPLEEMLVDQIVTAHWRKRRVLTAEAGEIALNVDDGHWRRNRGPNPPLQWMEWSGLGDPAYTMSASAEGNMVIGNILGHLRERVEREGELTEAAVEASVRAFRGRPNHLTEDLARLQVKLQANPEGLEPAAWRARNRAEALSCLDHELSRAASREEECRVREQQAEVSHQAAAALPDAATLDKILRYEAALDRQIYRAIAQLERLQCRRRGEDIPAPPSVDFAERT